MTNQNSTPLEQEYITVAIFNISTTDAGRNALIANIEENPDDNILKALTTMANQHNTQTGLEWISRAIRNISTTDAGKNALIANIKENPDDNILKALTSSNQHNTLLGQSNITLIKSSLNIT